jgi:hypothetical protein
MGLFAWSAQPSRPGIDSSFSKLRQADRYIRLGKKADGVLCKPSA